MAEFNMLAAATMLAAVINTVPANDQEAMKQARELLGNNDFQSARKIMREVVGRSPRLVEAHILLGTALLEHDVQAARAQAIRALRLDYDNADALDLLTTAFVQSRTVGLSLADESRLRKLEITDYEEVLKRNPRWDEALYRLASQRLALERLLPKRDTLGRQRELDESIKELKTVVRLHESNADTPASIAAGAYYQLGRAEKHLGDFQKETGLAKPREAYQAALEAFAESFDRDATRVDSVGEIVLTLMAMGQSDQAAPAVASRIERVPAGTVRRAKMHSMLGNIYVDAGQFAEAREQFDKTLSIDTQLMDAYLGLHRAYLAQGDLDGAKQALQRALEAEPRFVLGNLQLGRLAAREKDYQTAARYFEAVMAVRPAEAIVLGMMPSRNLYRAGLFNEAAGWLAWIYLTVEKNPEKALRAGAAATRFGEPDAWLADTIGVAYHRVGKHREAIDVLKRAVRLRQDYPSAYFHLAQAHAAIGQKREAKAALKRALASKAAFSSKEAAEKLLEELEAG